LSEEAAPRRTTLYDKHIQHGGKIVDFYGWDLPVQYAGGIIAEHEAVRNYAGLFDVSHMGEVLVEGPGSKKFLEFILTNSLDKLTIGKVLYSPMCYPDGGTVDDLIVYMMGEERYFIVVNASNTQKDFEWMLEQVRGFDGVRVENISDKYSQLAIQGPKAEEILQTICSDDLSKIRFFRFIEKANISGIEAIVSRTGYTGEDGFEIYLDPKHAPAVWDMLMEARRSSADSGLTPAGLGARDTLRLEAGLPLYGHELDKDITPVEAGLTKFISFSKAEFNGKAALQKQYEGGSGRRLTGFEMTERGIPRAGYEIEKDGNIVGVVASGSYSPSLDANIGTAFVPAELTAEGSEFNVIIRGKPVKAVAVKLPFNRKRYKNREDVK